MLSDFLHPVIADDIKKICMTDLNWGAFSGKTIFISGANGFLPSYLVYTFLLQNDLKNLNCQVIALARDRKKAADKFEKFIDRKDFEVIIQDVNDPVSVKAEIDFVIHAASQASPKYYSTDPVGTLSANISGTQNLLELAKEKKAKAFMFFSSSEVYGNVPDSKNPIKENEFGPLDPAMVRACYAESKRMGETMCVSWMHQYGVPVKIVRPFHTYGPGMRVDDGRVYADFVSDIVNGRDIVMKSDGRAKRAFCYLRDATEGFLRVLLDGESGKAYNIGNPDGELGIIELAELLVKLFPEKKLKVIKNVLAEGKYLSSTILRNCPDISSARQLGWQPLTTIEEGFRRTIQSYS